MIKELLSVLELTKIVYTQNFTTESNYFFIKDKFLWTSNTNSETIVENETIIFHTLQEELPFNNCGIPTAKFFAILKTLSEDAQFTQKEDHILIIDGKKKIKLPIVEYTESPRVDLADLNYTPFTECADIIKNITQYVDKTDEDGSRIHFINKCIYSTDRNSFHKSLTTTVGLDFSVPIEIFVSMFNFDEYAVDDYLYLKKGNTIAVTKYYDPIDVSFITDVSRGEKLELPNIIDTELFKIFNADTKKPDREVTVTMCDGVIRVESGNENTGFVSVEGETPFAENISFTCNAEKFELLCKGALEVYIDREMMENAYILIGVFENYEKYIVVEEV